MGRIMQNLQSNAAQTSIKEKQACARHQRSHVTGYVVKFSNPFDVLHLCDEASPSKASDGPAAIGDQMGYDSVRLPAMKMHTEVEEQELLNQIEDEQQNSSYTASISHGHSSNTTPSVFTATSGGSRAAKWDSMPLFIEQQQDQTNLGVPSSGKDDTNSSDRGAAIEYGQLYNGLQKPGSMGTNPYCSELSRAKGELRKESTVCGAESIRLIRMGMLRMMDCNKWYYAAPKLDLHRNMF
ncbi:hypothetical protein Nepgr_017960 [Nepenthes gracilis]|uniref:Uncharacterized protein n=1 Tax=Nepenthes gracilis TaxID=150966 RepID=A0AAD3SSM8_NEPGR|nr:hypothetical protein Nepgr_017960 [Nepenthes gracilis]